MTASPGFKGSDSSSPGARPFLKWAGGKTQLLSAIEPRLPPGLADGTHHAVRGAVRGERRRLLLRQPAVSAQGVLPLRHQRGVVLVYQVVKRDVSALIEHATVLADEYAAASETGRRDLFYRVRERFNRERATVDHAAYGDAWVERAARLLFLNKTCFNGLFRVNSRGEFNAPFGKYKKPRICNATALEAASRTLANTEIRGARARPARRWSTRRRSSTSTRRTAP